jgi:hypothetical protein
MRYCPQCLTEYAEGSHECIDCHVALRPGVPLIPGEIRESKVKLVRVRTFTGPMAHMDAELAKSILEAAEIPCVLPGQASADAYPGLDVVQLLVREEDATEAVEALENFLANSDRAATNEEPGPIE